MDERTKTKLLRKVKYLRAFKRMRGNYITFGPPLSAEPDYIRLIGDMGIALHMYPILCGIFGFLGALLGRML